MVLVEMAAKVSGGGGDCIDACGANVSKYDNVDYLSENPSFPLPMTIRVHFHDCE